jgi:glutathione S-transferase
MQLYHYPLCPLSRQIRVILSEKQLDCELVIEKYWQRNISLAKLNPAVEVPVLLDKKKAICDVFAIIEYLEETFDTNRLLGEDVFENAEIRRLISWFSHKMHYEVTKYILNEKMVRFFTAQGQPDTDVLRVAKNNLDNHIQYLNFLLNKRDWLAGNRLTHADIAAASQLSVLDYFGEINWDDIETVKSWYAVIKSRPSFRGLLQDRISGFSPSKHYVELDF